MKNGFLLCSLVVLGLSSWPTDLSAQLADQDFAARCAGSGVLRCVGFDNTSSHIVRGTNLHADGGGTYRAGLDSTMRASGGGSLRFDVPPPPHAGANLAGSWSPTSNDGLGRLFGQNSTVYIQYRIRFSPEFLNNTWNATWKNVIFHMNQTTCGQIELTLQEYSNGIPQMYTGCGSTHMYTNTSGTAHSETPPLLIQQGDYSACAYGSVNATNCFQMVADEWLTFYYKFTIGTWGSANSTVESWVAREGQGYRQWIRTPNMRLYCNATSCGSNPGASEGYNNLTITPYMTGLSTSSGRAGVTSRLWYDELIVSTQPIPAPVTGPRPQPPTNVTAN